MTAARQRRIQTASTVAALAVSIVGLGLSGPARADNCPNAALREQNNSTQLPNCRAYELVSPVFKEGFASVPTDFTDDGRLAYQSNGNYANNGNGTAGGIGGNQYVAVRADGGWFTKALAPSGPAYTIDIGFGVGARAVQFSRDLRSSLWVMSRGDQVLVHDLYLERPDNVFTRIGSVGNPLAPLQQGSGIIPSFIASDDLSHVVFNVAGKDVYPGTVPAGNGNTYEYVGVQHDDAPKLVSVDNAGKQISPGCSAPYNAISGDGRVIVWTSQCGGGQIWARVDGTTTVAVSESQCTRSPSDPGGACNAPGQTAFQGASADGTRVYFTTTQQLVNADTDATVDLYECDIPRGTLTPVGDANHCSTLRLISGAAGGADVQRVMRFSDDGTRVYFVATGVLASNPGANDAVAATGDDNLYVWHSDAAHPVGETRFVAKLDPADDEGGLAQTTKDGRYLVFGTRASLIDHGPQADTDVAQDLYRYDANGGVIVRLSTDAGGDGGNDPARDAKLRPIVSTTSTSPRLAMSDDGRSVVFVTDEALAADDTNGTIDSYLWHDGRVALISSGKRSEDNVLSATDVTGVVVSISPSGRDVYFTTTAQLTPDDVDTVVDIYDARVGGGFDRSVPQLCSGDACQGEPALPSSKPGSTSSTGQDDSPQIVPSFSVRSLTAEQRRRIASTGRVVLSVTTNVPGMLSASASAQIAKRTKSVGAAKRRMAKAGTGLLVLTLSQQARAALKSAGRLSVKVVIRQNNVAIPQKVALKLSRTKTAKKTPHKTSQRAASKGGRS